MFDAAHADYQKQIRERVEIALYGAHLEGDETQLVWQPALAGIAEVIGTIAAQSGAYATPKARRDLAKYMGDLILYAMKESDRKIAAGEIAMDVTVSQLPSKPS